MKNFILTFIALLYFQVSMGQGWEKTFGESNRTEGRSGKQCIDGGFVLIGHTTYSSTNSDIYLLRLNAYGETIWEKNYGGNYNEFGYSVHETSNRGFIISASTSIGTDSLGILIMQTDQNGEILWTNIFNIGLIGLGYLNKQIYLEPCTDSGYIISCRIYTSPTSAEYAIYLLKINHLGEKLWDNSIVYYSVQSVGEIQETSDGNFIIIGTTFSSAQHNEIFVIKTNQTGSLLWANTFGKEVSNRGNSIKECTDGGYIFTGARTGKINPNGVELWTKEYAGNSVTESTDGNFGICGSFHNPATERYNIALLTIDKNGEEISSHLFGGAKQSFGYSIDILAEGGFMVVGSCYAQNPYESKLYLIKTDHLNESFTNVISGKVFYDINSNCIQDPLEYSLGNRMINVEPTSQFALSDSNGKYSISVGPGEYNVTEFLPSKFWENTCSTNQYSINFSPDSLHQIVNEINFSSNINVYCPILSIDIAMTPTRRCFENTIYVHYFNNGNAPAENVFVKILIDTALNILSSSQPWRLPQYGHEFIYDVGTLLPGQRGSIFIKDSISCDIALGSPICIKSTIFPHMNCLPVDSAWDRSSISVSAQCLLDLSGEKFVQFIIKNDGLYSGGDMATNSNYRIYIDNALHSTAQFKLLKGESISIQEYTPGQTIRLEADQTQGHPGFSKPSVIIDGCTGNMPTTNFSSLLNSANDDEDEFIEISCKTIIGSFDPNDKSVQPKGVSAKNYVPTNSTLEYHINFQNTGTDTAFRVIVTDTLSKHLDLSTFQSGVSSHPYNFKFRGKNILEWTFNNILLPDSNVNELLSHGFVKFKIKIKPEIAQNTTILNRAGIVFDYNAPVMTNYVDVVANDTILIYESTTSEQGAHNYTSFYNINVVPNPVIDRTTFVLPGKNKNEIFDIHIYDAVGKVSMIIQNVTEKTFSLNINQLKPGLYLFRVEGNMGFKGRGKLVLQE